VPRDLRIVIDARLEPGKAGGVVQLVLGLAQGLAGLDGGDQYRFLVRPGHGGWLEPHLAGGLRLLEAVRPEAPLPPPPFRRRLADAVRRRLAPPLEVSEELVPPTKGVAEAFGADAVHLPSQQGFTTAIPTMYHPWDLQHVHFPQFFEADDRRNRDLIYRALSRQARVVVTATRWAADDVVANLGVPRRKVAVIPAASPLTAYGEPTRADLERVREAYDLHEAFVLYPAQSWPHKNHLALVDAVALLAHEGVRIPVVCAGWLNDFFPTIERRVREAGVGDHVVFLRQVPGEDMGALYRLARAMVFPSLFEGWGFPILEAFSLGVPLVCSDIPSTREVVGDGAATFDPDSPEELARQLRRVWEDEGLRRELVERGRARNREFSWERTARLCRAHYRRLAGVRLGAEDRALVAETAA